MTRPSGPHWSDPELAFSEYRTGMSPYLHYFEEVRLARENPKPQPGLHAQAGSDLLRQMKEAMDKLIEDSLR